MIRLALAVAALTLTAGCTASNTGPAPSAVPRVVDGSTLRLPLDDYLLTGPEAALVAQARRVLMGQCLRPFGMSVPEQAAGQPGPPTLNERRYGITKADQARHAGYRLPGDRPERPRQGGTPDPLLLGVITGTGPAVVHGVRVPAGGCLVQVNARLDRGEPRPADTDLAQRLTQDSFFASHGDSRVQAAIQAWSACMRTRGFSYPDPLRAAADPRFQAGPVTRIEIQTATADLACKQQVNLVGIWYAVEAAAQRGTVAANAPALERIRAMNRTHLAVAHSLLG